MYVVAREINGNNQYMRELSGDNCFSDNLSDSITYENKKVIPALQEGEFVVKVVIDDEDWIYIRR